MSLSELEAMMQQVDINEATTMKDVPLSVVDLIRRSVAQINNANQDASQRLEGMSGLRKALSTTPPPIDAVLDSGVAPLIVHFLRPEAEGNSAELLFEASWAMLNLMSGDERQVQRASQSDESMKAAIALIANEHLNFDTRGHGVWIVANVAGTNFAHQEKMFQMGCFQPLMAFLEHLVSRARGEGGVLLAKPDLVQNCVWAIGNMTRRFATEGFPVSNIHQVIPYLGHVTQLIGQYVAQLHEPCFEHAAFEVVSETIGFINSVVNADIFGLPSLPVEMLHGNGSLPMIAYFVVWAMQLPWPACNHFRATNIREAVRVLGNLACGSDESTSALLERQCAEATFAVLKETLRPDSDRDEIRVATEASWCLSNFAATPSSFQRLSTMGLLEFLNDAISHCQMQESPRGSELRKLLKELWMVVANLAQAASNNVSRGNVLAIVCGKNLYHATAVMEDNGEVHLIEELMDMVQSTSQSLQAEDEHFELSARLFEIANSLVEVDQPYEL